MANDLRSRPEGGRPIPSPLRRILGLLFGKRGPAPRSVTGVPAIGTSRSILRKLYDDIGHFLFSHSLDLTPLNFGCAHDYMSGADRQMVADVDIAIRERRLSNGWVEDYLARQDHHLLLPDALHETTASLERELARCIDLLAASADHQERYGSTLAESAGGGPPDRLVAHLRDLTGRMIEQSRLAEREMRQSHGRVSELRATLRAARRASKHDHLTGLPNRRGFERAVEVWRGSEGATSAVLAICDIDHFKAVNDKFGHDTGDRVLKLVADELHALADDGHEVARLGGEEFVVFGTRSSLEQAAGDLDRIRLSLAARHLVDSVSDVPIGSVTFSAGLAVLHRDEALVSALRRADAALYDAKRQGRNRIHAATHDERIRHMRW